VKLYFPLLVIVFFLSNLCILQSTANAGSASGLDIAKKYGYLVPTQMNAVAKILQIHKELEKYHITITTGPNGELQQEGETAPESLLSELAALNRYIDGLWDDTKWQAFQKELTNLSSDELWKLMNILANPSRTNPTIPEGQTSLTTDETYHLYQTMQHNSQSFKMISEVFKQADYRALLDMSRYGPDSATRKELHIHISDVRLDEQFWLLATAMALYPKKVRQVLFELTPSEQQHWEYSNGIDGTSRLEPYDVVLSRIRIQMTTYSLRQLHGSLFYEQDTTNIVRFGQILDQYLQGFFDPTVADLAVPGVLRTDLFTESYTVLCFSPYSKYELNGNGYKQTFHREGFLFQKFSTNYKQGNSLWNFSCKEKNFQIKEKVIGSQKIELPKKTKPKKLLKAVAALSLTGEMTKEMLDAGMVYLHLLGFTDFDIQKTDDLKKSFLELATASDVIVPIGHSFGFGKIKLGTQHGTIVHATKKVGKSVVKLSTFFPPVDSESNQSVFLNADDMGSILNENNHKTIFTMSCWSQSSIDTWMLSYLKAKKNGANVKAPFIFASEGSYETSNPFVILSHLDAPIFLLENLAKGKTYEDIYKGLATGFRRSIPGRISTILAESTKLAEEWSWNNFGRYIGTLMAPQIFQYQPVANFNNSKYTDGSKSTAEIELYNRDTGELIGSY